MLRSTQGINTLSPILTITLPLDRRIPEHLLDYCRENNERFLPAAMNETKPTAHYGHTRALAAKNHPSQLYHTFQYSISTQKWHPKTPTWFTPQL